MAAPSEHPAGCGCGVCKTHRERMASDQRYREIHAGDPGDDAPPDQPREQLHVGDGSSWDPPTGGAGSESRSSSSSHETVREVHHHHHEQTREAPSRDRGHDHGHDHGRRDKRPSLRAERRRSDRRFARRRHRHHGFLRFLVVGAVLVWLLHSFYPGLNVPFLPGISCAPGQISTTTPRSTVAVPVAAGQTPPPDGTPVTPAGTVVQPVGIGSFLGDTIGHAVKALVLHVAEAGLHAIGATARAMLDSPPSVTDMRSGLMADAEQLGHVTGWVAAALSGHTVTADPSVATAPAPGQPGTVQAAAGGGCGACPGQAAPAVVTAPGRATGGAVAAARAVLAAGRDWDPATAVAVAGAESSWRPDARNASSASGLFQMKYPMHKALFGGAPWSDPYANARAAHALWRTNGWSQPWVTYRKGTYLKFMPAARAAVAQAGGFVTRPAPAARPRTAQVSFTTGTSAGVMVDGHKVSPVAARQLRLAEKLGGINLTVMQGGYGGSHVAASGTSHNYPGVVDVSPGTVGVERLLRQVGFAAWARNIPGRSSIGSGAHVHAVSLLDAGDAKAPQVVGSWARHGNGLGGNTDPAPHYAWVPNLAAQVGATALGSPGGATVTAISCADPPRAPAAKPKPPVAPKAPAPAPRAPRKSPGPPTAQAAA